MYRAYYDRATGEITKITNDTPEGDYIEVEELWVEGFVDDGELKAYPEPAPSIHHKFDKRTMAWYDHRSADVATAAVRRERDNLIAQTDWTQLPDVSSTLKSAYTEYRQALRDVTKQSGFPYNVEWPSKPEV